MDLLLVSCSNESTYKCHYFISIKCFTLIKPYRTPTYNLYPASTYFYLLLENHWLGDIDISSYLSCTYMSIIIHGIIISTSILDFILISRIQICILAYYIIYLQLITTRSLKLIFIVTGYMYGLNIVTSSQVLSKSKSWFLYSTFHSKWY